MSDPRLDRLITVETDVAAGFPTRDPALADINTI